MVSRLALGAASAALVLAVTVSCNGLVYREGCNGQLTRSNASGFCDDPDAGSGDLPPGPGPYPPGPGFDSGCGYTTTNAIDNGTTCHGTYPGGQPAGAYCQTAEECERVCCEADSDGVFRPGGAIGGDASAGMDASASADASENADAATDAGAVTGHIAPPRWIAVCNCGVCATAAAACDIENAKKPLGGP